MNILNKIFLILIALSIFVFLVSISFITNNLTKVQKPYYENNKRGLYKLVKDEKKYNFIKIDLDNPGKYKSNSGNILVEQLNDSDKILFYNGKIKTKFSKQSVNINITPGLYLFRLNDINKNYTIYGSGFKLSNKGPGDFFVNSINPKKILIFSKNNIIDLKLKNIKTNEEITKIKLYPHEYFIFNYSKTFLVQNADILKIAQVFTLGYYNKKIYDSENFVNLISNRDKQLINITINIINFIIFEDKQKIKYINDFLNSKLWSFPGEQTIAKYLSIFINKDKKAIYYKNIILKDIYILIKNKKIDIASINNIYDNIKILENIDKNAAEEIKKIIIFQYTNIINSSYPTNTKINFARLINKISNNSNKKYLQSLVYIKEIFDNYNSDNFYEKINIFTSKYFDDLKINLNSKDKNKINIEDASGIDYMLYFLENIMLNSDTSGKINIGDIIHIFNNYVEISEGFYKYNKNNTKRVGLFTYSKILNRLKEIIFNTYFEKQTKNNLLKIKENIDINIKDIKLLESSINKVFSFFKNNTKVLLIEKSKKDKFLQNVIYPNLIKKYKEYFYALKNYEEYLAIYDNTKKEILEAKSINEGNTKIILTIEKAKKYLSTFNGLSFQNTKINVMDYAYCLDPIKENENIEVKNPYCYKIENLYIDGQKTSFILYPFLQNKIDNIVITGKAKSGSYKLDEIQKGLEKKLKTVKKDKYLYIFENYLLNTFGRKINNTNISTNIENDTNKNIYKDDSVTRILKRDKLLGKKGDFSNILKIINIKYNEINVERNGDKYDIYINKSTFNISFGKNTKYKGLFSSKYNFSEKHSFINPEIQLQDKKGDKFLLFGNTIYIKGEVGVNNIEEKLIEILKQYSQIDLIVKEINKLTYEPINIYYDLEEKTFEFKTKYNQNNIYIKLDNGMITSTKYKGKYILNKKINYKLINNILNKITK